MSARGARAVAVVVAGGLAVLWWRATDVAAKPPAQRAEASPAAASRPLEVAAGSQAAAERQAGELDRSAAVVDLPTMRSLTVHVDRGGASMPEVPVELLFAGSGEPLVRQALRVGRSGSAEWTQGDAHTWPVAVDLGFPTVGGAVHELVDGSRASLRLPALGALSVQVLEVDERPSAERATVEVRAPSAKWPADRWHRRPLDGGRCELPVKAGGQQLEVRVVTDSQRVVTATVRAPEAAGERAHCLLRLPADTGTRFALRGLPDRDEPWTVELFSADGRVAARAPAHSGGYLGFGRDAAAVDDGGLVLARSGGERWWGVLAGRAAVMAPSVELARGRLLGADGQGIVGAPLQLEPAGVAAGRSAPRLETVRTGPGGAFVVRGPDAGRFPVVLRVAATGEVVALPQTGPLSLRAGH